LSVLNTISDSGDGVVKVGSALGGVEDTTSVSLEGVGVSLDGDGNNTLLDGSLKLRY